eukprot:750722-Hanusia_phi.AAC.6
MQQLERYAVKKNHSKIPICKNPNQVVTPPPESERWKGVQQKDHFKVNENNWLGSGKDHRGWVVTSRGVGPPSYYQDSLSLEPYHPPPGFFTRGLPSCHTGPIVWSHGSKKNGVGCMGPNWTHPLYHTTHPPLTGTGLDNRVHPGTPDACVSLSFSTP